MRPSAEKFATLRARIDVARRAYSDNDLMLARHYGPEYKFDWLNKGERARRTRLRDAWSKAGDKFYAYVQSISPRDWSYGVPTVWIYDELTFADAIRPANESLSVRPPLPYGATEHRV